MGSGEWPKALGHTTKGVPRLERSPPCGGAGGSPEWLAAWLPRLIAGLCWRRDGFQCILQRDTNHKFLGFIKTTGESVNHRVRPFCRERGGRESRQPEEAGGEIGA